jgi:hypothetical protein
MRPHEEIKTCELLFVKQIATGTLPVGPCEIYLGRYQRGSRRGPRCFSGGIFQSLSRSSQSRPRSVHRSRRRVAVCDVVMIPMMKDDELIGTFSMSRVQNFASQAVIAIEKRPTAQRASWGTGTVISSSPSDLEAVFRTMLENATYEVEVEPVGEFELKGIRRPLAAYNVLFAGS